MPHDIEAPPLPPAISPDILRFSLHYAAFRAIVLRRFSLPHFLAFDTPLLLMAAADLFSAAFATPPPRFYASMLSLYAFAAMPSHFLMLRRRIADIALRFFIS